MLKNIINNFSNWVLDIIIPPHCLGCNTRNETLCDLCVTKIQKAERETANNIFAAFDYRNPIIKKAIWDLKYHHRFHLGIILGRLLYENFLEEIYGIRAFASGQPILVIPVPISHQRRKTRGYNQAEKLAKSFCNCGEKNIFQFRNNIIRKDINTTPQAKITNRKRRLKNIENAFTLLDKEIVKDRIIIIIDDVTTTGGTINEIMKILKKAGAEKILGFAIAH